MRREELCKTLSLIHAEREERGILFELRGCVSHTFSVTVSRRPVGRGAGGADGPGRRVDPITARITSPSVRSAVDPRNMKDVNTNMTTPHHSAHSMHTYAC